MTTTTVTTPPRTTPQWPVAGRFLDALVHREFGALATCLQPDVRFRAMVPRGPFELSGAAPVAAQFETWFGGDDAFEVVDASIGQVGARLYLRWRVRMSSAGSGSSRVAEQHAFAIVDDRIAALDLLCSGFQTTEGES